MKKTLTAFFLSVIFVSYAQEDKRTTDIFSFKVGVIGAWLSYEKAVNDHFTLNSEFGYVGGFFKGTNSKADYVATTTFNLEPRHYYNFNRRSGKGKETKNNSANYISSEFFLIPDLLSSTNRDNLFVNRSLSIVPKYGLRRSISEYLIFEFAFGIGYQWVENKNNGVTATLNLSLNLKL